MFIKVNEIQETVEHSSRDELILLWNQSYLLYMKIKFIYCVAKECGVAFGSAYEGIQNSQDTGDF